MLEAAGFQVVDSFQFCYYSASFLPFIINTMEAQFGLGAEDWKNTPLSQSFIVRRL
jgi:hypothetical protein